jgi:nucleoside-diphosphate-sugar epimerase
MSDNVTHAWSLSKDIDAVVDACSPVWPELRGAHLLITGGTGFIGCWMLETLCRVNDRLGIALRATVLTRDAGRFRAKVPHLAGHRAVDLVEGDVRRLALDGAFTHLVHAATDASADLNENAPLRMFDTVLEGTRQALQFAVDRSIQRVLYFSSGAVYGNQPWELERVPESWMGGPNCLDPRATYAEAKRAAEMLCAIYAKQHQLQVPIARIFALLGPYLSLDIHFAAGNFIRDAMVGKPIVVNGNGLPQRSYLYAGDLTTMLWHLLVRGKSVEPYNLGSDQGISIADLARMIGRVLGQPEVKILGAADRGWNLGRYVPDTSKLKAELGLERTVSLEESIRRTALWNGWKENKQ